jgi:methylthioribulose-1-phosphate dehydratase
MSHTVSLEEKQHAYFQLRQVKSEFAAKGWFPATSGNLSMRVGEFGTEDDVIAITASGKDKSQQTAEDFLIVNKHGIATEHTSLKPSAETLIHCEIYRLTQARAIFHVHTVFNNLISELYAEQSSIPIEGVEIIKAFNIWDEDARIEIPVLPNYASIAQIVPLIQERIQLHIPGIVLRKHGVYAWGASTSEAQKHLEAFEFLFEYAYRWHMLHT